MAIVLGHRFWPAWNQPPEQNPSRKDSKPGSESEETIARGHIHLLPVSTGQQPCAPDASPMPNNRCGSVRDIERVRFATRILSYYDILRNQSRSCRGADLADSNA